MGYRITLSLLEVLQHPQIKVTIDTEWFDLDDLDVQPTYHRVAVLSQLDKWGKPVPEAKPFYMSVEGDQLGHAFNYFRHEDEHREFMRFCFEHSLCFRVIS